MAIDLFPGSATLTLTGGTPILGISRILTPGPAIIRFTTYSPGVSIVRTAGTGNQLWIGAVQFAWKESTFGITKTLSGEWSAEWGMDFFGGYDPQALVGQDVAMFWGSVKRWGGQIQSVAEVGIQGNSVPGTSKHSVLNVKCGGYQLLTDRVIYAKLLTLFWGGTVGIAVYNFWYEKLRQLGVTKIGTAPSVFLPEQLFHYITGTEFLNKMKEQSPGYDWWIDDNKVLHYESTDPASGANAPFTIRDGDSNVDFMEVERSNVRFRNRQYVLPSADLVALRDDERIADGVSTSFDTDYALTAKPIVRVDGVAQIVQEFTVPVPGAQFYYIAGGIGVFAFPGSIPTVGQVVNILYPNPWPVAEMAEDPASIAAVGLYEAIWQAKNVYDRATAQSIAQTLIDLYAEGGFPVSATFEYNSVDQPAWLTPGMIIDVDRTFPTLVGDLTVEQVTSQEIGLTVWKHSVTLRLGLGDVGDAQQLEQFRISARVPINSPPYRLTALLFQDLPGITNPGAALGAIKSTYTVQCAGVISGWDIIFADDPPTGADFQMDVLLNGASIFPVGGANKVVALAGVTTLQQGLQFLTDNMSVSQGDKITLNVIQRGSVNRGANCTFHLNIKVPANPGQATN